MKGVWMILLSVLMVTLLFATTATASTTYIVDEASLLSQTEYDILQTRLEEFENKYDTDLYIFTLQSSQGDDIETCCKNALRNLGYNDNDNVVILTIAMQEREWCVYSSGIAIDAIDEDRVGNAITEDLSCSNYADAFAIYADECEYYINGAINGFPFEFGRCLIVSFAIGLAVALIVVAVMCMQLKSVRRQPAASDYLKEGSLNVTLAHEFFLYRRVNRVKKVSESSGSSGSSRSASGKF